MKFGAVFCFPALYTKSGVGFENA